MDDDNIAKISSGQILSLDYTVHPKWINENAEGGNFWSESVPKHENLESNVEVLQSEEVVIEAPNVLKMDWCQETETSEDNLLFDCDIPATMEEIVSNEGDHNYQLQTNESVDKVYYNHIETAAFETHPPLQNSKYIGPTNSRSLLKVQIKTNPCSMPSKMNKNSKFQQTVTIKPKYLKTRKKIDVRDKIARSNDTKNQTNTIKFRQTVKVNQADLQKVTRRNVHKKRTFKRKTKLVESNFGENITIIHDANPNQTSDDIINLKLNNSNNLITVNNEDSDIDVDVEADEPIELLSELKNLPSVSGINMRKMQEKDKSKTNYKEVRILDNVNETSDIPIPLHELVLNPNETTKIEQNVHLEFFGKNANKTPEQYLRIRNHIIDVWKISKPNYVSKTAVRNGLKHGGDVNCISRIHRLLEQIGAINFGYQGKYFEYIRPLDEYMAMFSHVPRNRLNAEKDNETHLERRQRRIKPNAWFLKSNFK